MVESLCTYSLFATGSQKEQLPSDDISQQAWLSHRRGPVDFNCEPDTQWENSFSVVFFFW